jgi:hypothetical protein
MSEAWFVMCSFKIVPNGRHYRRPGISCSISPVGMLDLYLNTTFCVILFRTYPSDMLLLISDLLLGICSSSPVCGNAPVSGRPVFKVGFHVLFMLLQLLL